MIRFLFIELVAWVAFVLALISVVLFFFAGADAAPAALILTIGALLLDWWAHKQLQQ